jgi:hypothetical protein
MVEARIPAVVELAIRLDFSGEVTTAGLNHMFHISSRQFIDNPPARVIRWRYPVGACPWPHGEPWSVQSMYHVVLVHEYPARRQALAQHAVTTLARPVPLLTEKNNIQGMAQPATGTATCRNSA